MKKLLTILGAVTLTVSPAQFLVSCGLQENVLDMPSNPTTQEDVVALVGDINKITSEIDEGEFEPYARLDAWLKQNEQNEELIERAEILLSRTIEGPNYGEEDTTISTVDLNWIKEWELGQELLLSQGRILAIDVKIIQYLLSLNETQREEFSKVLYNTYKDDYNYIHYEYFQRNDEQLADYLKRLDNHLEYNLEFYGGIRFLGSTSTQSKIDWLVGWIEKNNFA